MAKVVLKELCKSFGSVQALKNATLEINDKEFLVLVGPSGCGKTTALRCVAGLEEATSGDIYIGERRVNDVSPKDRDIAMVFQNYALYPHMSVFDNMAFGLKLRRVPRPDIEKRVQDTAKMLGMETLLKRRPKELSGGQRQRVALGRAIVREPAVFLMDEPLSNLDAKLRVQTRAELTKLHRRLGITTIYVTHDQVEAMTMGDRIAVMNEGLIQQVDQPLNLYNHPANLFVAGFIGSPAMNFVDAKLKFENGSVYVDAGSFRVAVPADRAEKARELGEREVVFGIRPEDLYDRSLSLVEAHESNTVETMVDVIEPMGSSVVLYLAVGDHSLIASVDADTQAKDLEPLTAVFDMEKAHLFDKETAAALF
jgi:multiple sugar transport system ATP-binding protein